jgi:hypothetical protein
MRHSGQALTDPRCCGVHDLRQRFNVISARDHVRAGTRPSTQVDERQVPKQQFFVTDIRQHFCHVAADNQPPLRWVNDESGSGWHSPRELHTERILYRGKLRVTTNQTATFEQGDVLHRQSTRCRLGKLFSRHPKLLSSHLDKWTKPCRWHETQVDEYRCHVLDFDHSAWLLEGIPGDHPPRGHWHGFESNADVAFGNPTTQKY